MRDFPDWLDRVLDRGESIQDSSPVLRVDDRPAVVRILRSAFARHVLNVAGPPVPFAADIAVEAAELLAQACWALVAGEGASLAIASEPASASAHLSADLVLRFLPGVYRRARMSGAAAELITGLERILRRWPLSGVLADLEGKPTTPLDFGGHLGLQLLYAERLVGFNRPGWVPAAGPEREWAERIFRERGRPLPVFLSEDVRE